jgi:phosphoglycolate phosphatase
MRVRLRVLLLAKRDSTLDQDRALPDVGPAERQRFLRPQPRVGQYRDQRRVPVTTRSAQRLDRSRRQRPSLTPPRRLDLPHHPRRIAADSPALHRPLQRTRYLLLDFDGPICAIFAGCPAPAVARELVDALRTDDLPIPERLDNASDPFDVLRYAGTVSPAAAERTDARLRAAELDAVSTATPTPHAEELISAWRDAGRRVAAVSNNSQAAVTAYLAQRGLELDLIIGRTSSDPALLKPSPHLVTQAVHALGAATDESVFVGDSPSDIAAGREAGVATIGYANKPGKRQRLTNAGARLVIDDLDGIARAVAGWH